MARVNLERVSLWDEMVKVVGAINKRGGRHVLSVFSLRGLPSALIGQEMW